MLEDTTFCEHPKYGDICRQCGRNWRLWFHKRPRTIRLADFERENNQECEAFLDVEDARPRKRGMMHIETF